MPEWLLFLLLLLLLLLLLSLQARLPADATSMMTFAHNFTSDDEVMHRRSHEPPDL